jgi:asparagine synthase (glutamine-hydrolysing)
MTAASASERLDTTKHALRRLAGRLLPADVVHRRKLGFPTPLDDWLGNGMMDFAREVLLDRRARERGIFDPQAIEDLLSRPQHLPYDFYGKKVWMLTNVELWLRELIDEQQTTSSGVEPAQLL